MKDFDHDDYNQRFGGIGRLYGIRGLNNLRQSHILVIGLGGVGSWAAEALVRSGVGSITIIDLDDICITNTNRQLPAMNGNIGKLKIDVIKERLLSINPQCQVHAIADFFTEKSADAILDRHFDYVIDAIDSLKNKALIATKCIEKNIPVILTGATAGKKDPTKVKVDDLGMSQNDGLLFRLRKKLRDDGVFAKVSMAGSSSTAKRQRFNLPCVYSAEDVVYPTKEGEVCSSPDPSSNLKLDCDSGMGSVSHITGLFGLISAGHVINLIVKKDS
jgi:tRNA A37 threonylcarbamoyladenosine dehydratase